MSDHPVTDRTAADPAHGAGGGGRGRVLLFVLPLVLFAVVAGYFGYQLLYGGDPRELPSALIDRPAPQFDLPPLPGHERGLATADLEGEISVVNVWASWCAPCRAEHPLIIRLAEEEGVQVYGINYKDAPEDAQAYLDELGDPYDAIGADRDGRVGIDWGVYGVPETYIVDAEGRIRYKHVGPILSQTYDEFAAVVRDLKR